MGSGIRRSGIRRSWIPGVGVGMWGPGDGIRVRGGIRVWGQKEGCGGCVWGRRKGVEDACGEEGREWAGSVGLRP